MTTQKPNLIFFLMLLSSFFLHATCHPKPCHPNDRNTLLQIKQAFNNPYVLNSWDPQSDCCRWHAVECDHVTGHVITLYVTYGDLVGPIPPQISDLSHLQTLGFHKNPNLTGPIPTTLSKLKKLQYLELTWNNLSGPIPAFVGEMATLKSISLAFNKLSGPIPSSIGTLPNLDGLRLDRNKLTGPIPDTFGNFKYENFYLYLNHNRLSGKIPSSLGKKKDFGFIDLSRNRLEGDASMLFGAGRTTETVDLSRNFFEFNLSEVKFQERLSHLDISHNKIFGSLPSDLTKLSLQHLNVSYNRLCGKIPVGGQLQGFGPTEYFHNRCLCGLPLLDNCN